MTRDVSLNTALSDFYRVNRGRYSASTWKALEGQLERWRTWITRETHPNVALAVVANPDERYMERYFNRLRPPAYSERSFNNYRQMFRIFWNYCLEEGWVRTNPMRHIDPVRVPKRVRLQLSAQEMLRMLDDAPPRDRVALALGMNTGLRAGDIASLTVGNINLTNNQINAFVEKTDEEMEFGITAELRTELVRWFHHYADAMGLPDWTHLPNDWQVVPPAQGVAVRVGDPAAGTVTKYMPHRRYRHPELIVHRALEQMGYPTRQEGFHTIRRSAARMFFDEAVRSNVGDPIRVPQTLLGHKNRATTEIYLGVTRDKQVLDDMMRGKSILHQAAMHEADEAPDVEDITGGSKRSA